MRVKFVPTILAKDFKGFKKRLQAVAPYFDLVQIDCGDGKFVGNRTFYNNSDIRKLTADIHYELHLMVKEPLAEIKKWVVYKKVKSVIFHFEAVKENEVLEIINFLHKKGIKAGLAINLETKVEKVIKFLPKLDVLLVMGVKPGWGGQEMSLKVVKSKVSKVRKMFPKLDIEVDGGVNLKNIKAIITAGANIIAAGSLLADEKIIKKIQELPII